MSKIVILPSAKLVPLELQNEFGMIPTAMIPLDSKPALNYIADYYSKRDFQVVVAAHENAEHIVDYCAHHQGPAISVFKVGVTKSIGETVCHTIESLAELPEDLVINFADTIIAEDLSEGNVICFNRQSDIFRWTTFEIDKNHLGSISEKWTVKDTQSPQNVFIGIFRIINVKEFLAILKETLGATGLMLDPFYCSIQRYFNDLEPEHKILQEVDDWFDFGHLDTYYETKKKLSLNCRHFNQVKVDTHRGIIRKTSRKTRKFIDEIRWVLKLPVGLQYIAPRIFRYDLSFDKPYVEMEFYGYPALSDMYLFGNHDIGVWDQVISSLKQVTQDMMIYRVDPEDKNDLVTSIDCMYRKKTIVRLKSVIDDPIAAFFIQDQVIINDQECFNLPTILDRLPELLDATDISQNVNFSIIHGDLCLSNILYDQRNRLVRLIDPRGSFGYFDIYGDPRYDIAKLCHSFEGDYDFLVNGLFDLTYEKGCLYLRPHLQKRHNDIKALFHQRILERWRESYTHIKLIESLLFLSMVPLHSDRPLSQQAFLARGIELFSRMTATYIDI